MNNFERLLSAGIGHEDAIEIARDSACAYNRNRKTGESPTGMLGRSGCHLFDSLAGGPKAFSEYQPYTTEMAAERACMSRGAIGPAAIRLIEHGFFDMRRDGRTFSYRLQIPAIALTEGAESYLEFDYAPGTFGYEHNRPLGQIVLKLFPRA